MSKKTRNIGIAVALLIVLVIGALLIYRAGRPEAQTGGKNIVVTVVHADKSSRELWFMPVTMVGLFGPVVYLLVACARK